MIFKIGCSQADGLQAVDVAADIQVEETPIEVLQGKHKKLYNMLLKAFAERVKTTIEDQLKVVIAASTPVLKAKYAHKHPAPLICPQRSYTRGVACLEQKQARGEMQNRG
eukprot:COSAG02_NODE_2623_length_8399_cov_21.197590_6_plen_110_part_00